MKRFAILLLACLLPHLALAQSLGYGIAFGLSPNNLSNTAKGTGYAATDTITLSCTQPSTYGPYVAFLTSPVITVGTVSSGAISTWYLSTQGSTNGTFSNNSLVCTQASTNRFWLRRHLLRPACPQHSGQPLHLLILQRRQPPSYLLLRHRYPLRHRWLELQRRPVRHGFHWLAHGLHHHLCRSLRDLCLLQRDPSHRGRCGYFWWLLHLGAIQDRLHPHGRHRWHRAHVQLHLLGELMPYEPPTAKDIRRAEKDCQGRRDGPHRLPSRCDVHHSGPRLVLQPP